MPTPTNKKRVLILCTGNSARSQMAEGILRHDGGETFEVESAGVKPSSVRPEAIQAMGESGLRDVGQHRIGTAECDKCRLGEEAIFLSM